MTTPTDEAIGERVHALMWRYQITQVALAKKLGIDQGSLSNKLRGRRPWFAHEVAVVAHELGTTVSDLYEPIEMGVVRRQGLEPRTR